MATRSLDVRLYLVTDPVLAGARGVTETVRAALEGGTTCVQLRDKQAETRELLKAARAIKSLCDERGVPFVINDRIDVALAVGADGVHLGQGDMPLSDARRLLGPNAVIGVSVRTVQEVREAEREGATYLAANGVWATSTKTNFGAALGLDGLRSLVLASRLPIVAIGGIDETQARELALTGAAGIAVVSAVMAAPDPAEACRRLRLAFSRD